MCNNINIKPSEKPLNNKDKTKSFNQIVDLDKDYKPESPTTNR
jgi:hypothetical protein